MSFWYSFIRSKDCYFVYCFDFQVLKFVFSNIVNEICLLPKFLQQGRNNVTFRYISSCTYFRYNLSIYHSCNVPHHCTLFSKHVFFKVNIVQYIFFFNKSDHENRLCIAHHIHQKIFPSYSYFTHNENFMPLIFYLKLFSFTTRKIRIL